jgi:hypothetical protein
VRREGALRFACVFRKRAMGLIGRLSNPSVRAMVHELSEISD